MSRVGDPNAEGTRLHVLLSQPSPERKRSKSASRKRCVVQLDEDVSEALRLTTYKHAASRSFVVNTILRDGLLGWKK